MLDLKRRIWRPDDAAMMLGLTLLALHALHVWGYTGLFWGDIGRWSHEVERLASGELPYRDFQWHYPPLGLVVEGMLARIVGTDRTPVSFITTGLAAVLVVAFVKYAREVLGRADSALVAVGLVLAFAFAQTTGAALPLGHYSPAVIVGAACIAIAALLFVKQLREPAGRTMVGIAIWSALAVLTKQDFWIPAAYLVGVTSVLSKRLTPVFVSGAIIATGVAMIVATAGVDVLLPLVGGFGHAARAGGQGFPSWERLTVEILVLALIGGACALIVGVATRRLPLRLLVVAGVVILAAAGTHLLFTINTDLPAAGSLASPTQIRVRTSLLRGDLPLRPALGWLRYRVTHTPIPVLLAPLLLLLVALRWKRLPSPRRATVALLLGFAIALRARRAFEGTEWFEFLLTLPVLAATAALLLPLDAAALRRARAVALAGLSIFALWSYRSFGTGWGTRRHYPALTTTPRGRVHWAPGEARGYKKMRAAIDSIDPSGTRPVLGFGYGGGWNYWLRRHNPYPFSQDFFFSAFDADSVLAQPRPAGLLLIDNLLLAGTSFGAARFDWRHWEQPRVPTPYDDYDRVRFDRLREGCEEVAVDVSVFRLYACP